MDKNTFMSLATDTLVARCSAAAQMHAATPVGVGHAIISVDTCTDLEDNEYGITLRDICEYAESQGTPLSVSNWEWGNVVHLANARTTAKGGRR